MGEISKKVQESRLKWYGHVLRRDEEYLGKRVMAMEVSGKGRRARPIIIIINNNNKSTKNTKYKFNPRQCKTKVIRVRPFLYVNQYIRN